ncbi:hypothetical protein FOZ63_023443 [Perkinsus olseni]|uniref:Uncharacterized protein n=1 Tax=Perkinsus olseni TaxID=32597 RepID=A0A7J6Q387_PEROL|nr:hypothetical protein FOZ62_012761 [Perkinsus olseni]KAF4739980.1 hypothetical protein FOZ63_023443 [Perkinsus olseni]
MSTKAAGIAPWSKFNSSVVTTRRACEPFKSFQRFSSTLPGSFLDVAVDSVPPSELEESSSAVSTTEREALRERSENQTCIDSESARKHSLVTERTSGILCAEKWDCCTLYEVRGKLLLTSRPNA